MFKKKEIKGLVCLLAIMLVSKGWATDVDRAIRQLEGKETRKEAVASLEKIGTSAVPSLLSAIEDKKGFSLPSEGKIAVILLLGKIKDKTSREPLEKRLKNDKDPFIREASALSLGNIKDKASIPVLKKGLNDKSSNVRMRSALSLARLGDKSGYEPSLKAMKEKDATASLLSIDVLEAIGDKNAIPILQGYIREEESSVWTRIYSGLAIKKLEIQGLSPEDRLAFLRDCLGDKNSEVVRWVSEELKNIVRENQPQRDEVVNILKECLKEHPKPQSYAAFKILLELLQEKKIEQNELKDL
jgi:HEAT repeat protein